MEETPPPTPPAPPEPKLPTPGGGWSAEERQMAMWCHLASFAGYIIPFGNVLGPLVLWLTKRETMPFVDQEGKESVNFQICITIYILISIVLMFFCIGFFLLIAVAIFEIVVVVLACIEASKGNAYRYPLCIRFID